MDSAADKSKYVIALPHSIYAFWQGIQKVVFKLARLVILTEEERINAGIYTDHAKQDERVRN